MTQEIQRNELDEFLSAFDYPATREELVAACEGVTLRLADGEVNLGETVADSNADEFVSPDDLAGEVNNLLPRRAVGEPYQSEGEG